MVSRLALTCTVLTALIAAVSLRLGSVRATEEDPSCFRCPACCQFNQLNNEIRDAKIDRVSAQARFRELIPVIRENYYSRGGSDFTQDEWVFPLDEYGPKAIGGRKGSGFRSKGHDYFDGNNHRSHPAHDIFIHDKDRDCLDDRTGKPVMVRSMTNGIVVAEETGWDTTSHLKGGNYIWIYNPSVSGLAYYSHNAAILVAVGDIVRPGDFIATVGRTGINAFKERSPTHLHFSYLEVYDGNVVARNLYRDLVKKQAERVSVRSPRASLSTTSGSPYSSTAGTEAVASVAVCGFEGQSAGYATICW
jgi:murein DD-endopeptidase MepM/ murein hydrolase activator NlpD